jgi:hypothetical protein
MTKENNKSCILNVQLDEQGEFFIEFPEDFLKEVDWKEGDNIEWTDNHDGTWTMKKKVT